MAFRTIEVQLRAGVAAFTAQMGVAANSVKEFQNDIAKAAAANDQFVQSVGKASLVASGALALGLGLSARAAISFESAFAGVEKTVSGTQAEMSALSDGIRDMSKELPASAVEIASVAEAAGQLGIETSSILEFSRTMVDLGEATLLSATEAATSLAQLANITQMPQNEFDRLGSTVVALGNTLATTEPKIVEMGLRLAGAGAQVGLTEAQILSFAGALASVGIEAEAGGSAISKVMIEIANEVETGGDRLETFAEVAGMSATQFSAAYREDAAGALVAFIEGLGDMEAQGGSTLGVLADLEITEVRMRDALLRASGAGDLFRQSLELGTQAWEENTALQTEAEQRYATTAAQLEILRNKITDLGVDAGSVLLPAMNSVVEATGNMADGLASLPPVATQAATGFAAFSSVALGLAGTMVVIAPKIRQFHDAAENMGSIAQFTSRNLGRMVTGIGLAGLAIGAGVMIYERATRSAREYDEMVTGLAQSLGEVATGQREFNDVLEEFLAREQADLSGDQIEALELLGITLNDIRASIAGGGDALDPFVQAIRDMGVEVDRVDLTNPIELVRIAKELGMEGSEDLRRLIRTFEDFGPGVQDASERALREFGRLNDANAKLVEDAIDANTADGVVNYAAALAEVSPKAKSAESGTRGFTSATEDMADAAEKAEEALRELLDAYSAPLTPIFAMQDAMRGVEDANKAVRDSQKAFTDAQRDVIDANEAVAAAHRSVAEAQRTAQRNVAAAQRDAVSAAAEIEEAQIGVAKAMSMVADEAAAARRGVADLAAEQQAAVDPLFGMLDALEKQDELLGKAAESATSSGGRGFVPGEFEVTVSDMKEAMAGPGGRLEGGKTGTAGPSAADIAKGAADVTRAAIRLAGAIQTGEVSLEDSQAMLDVWVQQGLITADQAATLADQFEHAARKADELQGANVRGAISSSVQAERMRVEAERTEAVAAAQQKVVEATERAAAAQERVAEAAAEGAEAIEAAQERVVDAVDAAADAKDNLTDAADDMRDAEDRAARSSFELMIASIGLAGAIRNNPGLMNDAKRAAREMGEAMGWSKERIDGVIRGFDDAADAAFDLVEGGPYEPKLGLDTEDFWRELANARFALAMTQLEAQGGGARTSGLQLSTGGYITAADRDPIYRATGGPSGTDTIPAWLSPGEYVVQAAAVNALGLDTMHAINRAGTLPDARLPDVSGPGVMSAGGTTVINNVTHETNVPITVPPGVVENERDLARELDSALWVAGVT